MLQENTTMLLENIDTADKTGVVGNQPLTETEAAARLGLKVATLRAWRNRGRGPAYVRLGRAIRYLTVDIEEFLKSNRHSPRTDRALSPHVSDLSEVSDGRCDSMADDRRGR
jgi:predicted DNA-binding transcriptional regulator AlpA